MQDVFNVLGSTIFGGTSLLASAYANCTVNGKPVPCDQFFGKMSSFVFGFGSLFFLVFFILLIASFIFWIRMLIDSIKRDYDNKPVWILILLVTGLLGAIAYYFAVKKKQKNNSSLLPPTTT